MQQAFVECTLCRAQGLTKAHRTRSCPSGSGWAGGRKQAVESAPSAVLCPYGLRYTDPPRGQLSQQPFQTEAPDRTLPSSASMAPPAHARWLSPSLLAAQSSTPQSPPRLGTSCSALCAVMHRAAGRFCGVSAPSFNSSPMRPRRGAGWALSRPASRLWSPHL